MMKISRLSALFLALLLVLSGCASKNNSQERMTVASAPSSNKSSYDSVDYETGGVYPSAVPQAEAAYDSPQAVSGVGEVQQPKKIKNGYMNIETQEIQHAVNRIQSLTEETGGYIENMEMSIYTRNDKDYKSYYYTLRIPANDYEYVSGEIALLGEVINSNDNVEDASGIYADISAKLELKTSEEKRLLEFLDNAKAIEDILALEERLGEVRTDIEIYKDSLVNIDRRVSYSTLSINLLEVDSPYIIRPVSEKLGDRMKGGFSSSVTGVVNVFQGIVIGIVYISVPVAIIGACGFVGLTVYKRTGKKVSKTV